MFLCAFGRRLLKTAGFALMFGGVLVFAPSALAEVELPVLSSPVIDEGDFFRSSEEAVLIRKIRTLYDAGGPQLQVWTLKTLEGEPIESLSLRAVESWDLGRSGKDDGLLLTIARQEKRFRLEVGRGLEGTIPDALAGRMLRQILVPALRRSAPADGVMQVISEIAKLTLPNDSQAAKELKDNRQRNSNNMGRLGFFFLFLVVFLVLNRVSRAASYARRGGLPHRGWGGGGWTGGGGGGGWSGGGGGFSGGGASGGW